MLEALVQGECKNKEPCLLLLEISDLAKLQVILHAVGHLSKCEMIRENGLLKVCGWDGHPERKLLAISQSTF